MTLFLAAAALQRRSTRGAPRRRVLARTMLATAAATVLAVPVIDFRRHRTTVDPRANAAPARLVVTGLYAYTRNPMYLGMIGLLTAHALVKPGPRTLVPVILFAIWMDRIQVPAEEEALHHRFGDDYVGYATKVPRWAVPR